MQCIRFMHICTDRTASRTHSIDRKKKKITNYSLLLNAPFVTTRVREAVNEVKRTLHVFVSSCAFSVYLRFFSLVFLFISFRRRLGDLTA